MQSVSLEQFGVYVVVSVAGSDLTLDGKTRPHVLLRQSPSKTRRRVYMMAPLTTRPPRSEHHIPINFGRGVRYLLLDRISPIPRSRIKRAWGVLDFDSQKCVIDHWPSLIE